MTASLAPRWLRQSANGLRILLGERPLTQLFLLAVLIAAIMLLGRNLMDNMARAGLTPGFAFLTRPANFEIGETLIAYSADRSFGRAILVGFLNTLSVSAVSCVVATGIGVALGIGQLSSNPLLLLAIRSYVEVIRNTPLLLQLFFWNATVQALPGVRQALSPVPGVLLSNRGMYLPSIAFELGWLGRTLLALAVVSLLTALAGRRILTLRRIGLTGGAASLIALLALTLIGGGAHIEIPEFRGFNIAGGLAVTPEFTALMIGLSINASANIAEIVRSGIEAVPRGQWEAARSVAFGDWQIMRLIVLPQALRVIIPLMTSNWLSLIKNSSLAVAIGYPDLVNIANTTANQTGQALEAILIMMIVYLTINLTVSLAMNVYNGRHRWEPAS